MVVGRRLKVGAAVIAAYIAVAVATIGLSGHHVRPLYESVGPDQPYRWVHPPPLFAPSNTKPTIHTQSIPVAAIGNVIQVATGDAQVSVSLPAHSLVPPAGTTSIQFTITPVDPAKLGPLPNQLVASGNVYHVTMAFEPSGQDASPPKTAGDIVLGLPEPITTIEYSADGRTWTTKTAQELSSPLSEGTTFDAEGYYVGALPIKDAPPALLGGSGGGSSFPTAIVVVIVVVLAAVLVGVPMVIVRRRPKSSPPPAKRPPPKKKR